MDVECIWNHNYRIKMMAILHCKQKKLNNNHIQLYLYIYNDPKMDLPIDIIQILLNYLPIKEI